MRKLLFIFALVIQLVLVSRLAAQQLPVTVTTLMKPPYSLYLEDYGLAGKDILNATIRFHDFNEPSWNVRLKITIESDRIRLQTRPDFLPPAITVVPGVPLNVTGIELQPYFDLNNLNVSGASDLLKQSGRLPEGTYKFCVQVLDFESGTPLSEISCSTAWISLHDPPRIISPACGNYIKPMNPQNIVFQWQLTGFSPNFSMGVEYQLVIHEVIDIATDPRSAINNGKTLPVYESPWVTNPQLVYGMAEPLLDIGKAYVFYTQVKDIGGRDLFKNNGMSEICWFYFGYPENTKIQLLSPSNRYQYARRERQQMSWTTPHVKITAQPFQYYMKIVKMLPGQDSIQAIAENRPWYEYTSDVTYGQNGGFLNLPVELEPSELYAWQVICYSDVQKVAASDVFVFKGPPIVDYILAGNHAVKVISTVNKDFSKLTGTGKLMIYRGATDSQNDSIEVNFENIAIEAVGNLFFLRKGAFTHTFEPKKEITLTPELPENEAAYFYVEKLKLDVDGLEFYGEAKWPLPHSVQSSERAFVTSAHSWMDYDRFVLDGRAYLNDQNKFDLLEPMGFQIKLNTESYFKILANNYTLMFDGNVLLPDKVKGTTSSRISFSFTDEGQLYYISESSLPEKLFVLADNTGLYMIPDNYMLDLSELKSPGKKESLKEWKGIYFPDYQVRFKKKLDKYEQISLDRDYDESIEQASSSTHKNWVDQDGLDFYIKKTLSFSSSTFNTFPAKQKTILIKIENNGVTDSYLKGSIKVPIISESEDFEYTVPLTERGFNTGYLDETLDDTKFVFNKDGGEQKMNVTIQRAVFSNREKLNMMVDLEWPHMNATMTNVKGLSVWGDYNIGFNTPNGAVEVDKQTKTEVNGYPVTVDVVGCGRQSNLYSIGVSGKIVMGDDIAGPKGPTEVNIYSVNYNDLLDANVEVGGSINTAGGIDGPSISEADMKLAAEQKLNAAFSMNGGVLTDAGKLQADLQFDINGNVNLDLNANLPISFDGELGLNKFGEIPGFSLDALKALMLELSMNLPEAKRPEAMQVIEYLPKLSTEVQIRAFEELTDMKKLAIKLLRIKLEALIAELMEPITLQVNKLQADIQLEVDKVMDDVNAEIKLRIGQLVDGIAVGVIELAAEQDFEISGELEKVKAAIKTSLAAEISASLEASIKTNITGKFTGVINTKLLEGVRSHLAGNLTGIGFQILDGKGSAPKIESMMAGMDGVFLTLGKDIIASLDINNLKGSMLSLGNDLIANISVESIFNRMVDELLTKSVEAIISKHVDEFADELAAELGGEFLGILADNIQLDFSNLKEKLINGDIGGIIKFDPTNIKIETSIATVQGTIHFKDNDPTWGDAWGGKLKANLKIQPSFSASAEFMNGKKSGTSFWFFDVSVSDMNMPMAPTPFIFDGADGRVYHNMKVTNTGNYSVNSGVKYGANLQLNFYDAPFQGGIIKFDVGAKVEIVEGGFYIGMLGNAKVGNAGGFSLAQGKGELSYNSAEKHFLGIFEVSTNTSPLLCAGGAMGVEVKPGYWLIAVGTRENPIHVKPLCSGAFVTEGWFMINKSKIDLGMHIRQDIYISTPWIDLEAIEFKFFAEAGFDFGAEAVVLWDPFGVEKATVSLEMWAGVGCKYDWAWPGGSGTLNFARVELGGSLGFQTIEETTVSGKLHGDVEVLGFGVGFNMEVDHTF